MFQVDPSDQLHDRVEIVAIVTARSGSALMSTITRTT